MKIPELKFDEFAKKYCERMDQTPEGLLEVLRKQRETFHPTGWMLLEVAYIGAWNSGHYTIMPFGPNNSFKEVPDHPISPRGLASDMSTVEAILPMSELP